MMQHYDPQTDDVPRWLTGSAVYAYLLLAAGLIVAVILLCSKKYGG